jgi:hypothetical protein
MSLNGIQDAMLDANCGMKIKMPAKQDKSFRVL